MHALNVSLGQLRFQNCQSDHSNFDPVLEKTVIKDFQQTMSESCLRLNSKIHNCIDNMLKQDSIQPLNIEEIDIDNFIDDLDPDVWKVICLLTLLVPKR